MPDGRTPAGEHLPVVLAEPTRRQINELLRDGRARTRGEVADALGIPRSTAAFHLERLAAAGLLEVESRRLNGRAGPGAGRPAKLYRATEYSRTELGPQRSALAAAVMAEAIELAAGGESPRAALRRAADDAGRRLADGASGLVEALDAAGFDPRSEGSDVVLGLCPFHDLARARPGVVCELNHALVCGMAGAVGDSPDRVVLDPGAGECCLRLAEASDPQATLSRLSVNVKRMTT